MAPDDDHNERRGSSRQSGLGREPPGLRLIKPAGYVVGALLAYFCFKVGDAVLDRLMPKPPYFQTNTDKTIGGQNRSRDTEEFKE